MPATTAVAELAQIPFGTLIGAPLKASIEAQALAAKTTIEFIERIGFIKDATVDSENKDLLLDDESKDAPPAKIRNVVFQYSKTKDDGSLAEFRLTVPILAIVPIPYIRLQEVTIDFTAKLTDSVQTSRKDATTVTATLKAKYAAWWSPVSVDFRTSLSHETTQTEKSSYIREYTMKIHVLAVSDAMPAGLAKILQILEANIKERPVPVGP